MTVKQSRRSFLRGSALGLSSAWVASNWPGILEARAFAAQAAAGQAVKFSFFTKEQAAEINAVASQIIPSDDTPGAREAHCVYFIDRALTTFLRGSQETYRQGLSQLQAKTKQLFPDAASFSALPSGEQIQVLKALEKSRFFRAVRTHTVMGMFAPPDHGGNYDQDGWKLIGYDHALHFKPPFGYYDAKRG